MNTAFSSVLWKEYRALRWLWLGCLLGTAALGAGLWLMAASSAERIDRLPLLWSLALWFPVIYLLACTAATFAGEREERTDDWLRQLVVPAGTTIAAKLLWPLVSAAVMQVLLLGAAHLARQSERGAWVHAEPLPGDDMLRELPAMASFALFEVLAYGLFWSLITSRAVSAVVGGALSIIVVNVLMKLAQDSMPAWDDSLQAGGWLRTLLVAGILVADVWLARSWLGGRVRGWSLRLPSRFGWATAGLRAVRATSSVPREPSVPWRRAWQRLYWLESRTIRGFVLFSGVAACSVPLALARQLRPEAAVQILGYCRLVAIGLLPFVAGLLAWRSDQVDQRQRFFGHRGVTPAAIWLSRLAIWLGALLAALVVSLLIVSLGVMLVSLRNPGWGLWNELAQSLTNEPLTGRLVATSWSLQAALSLIIFLTTFAVGLYLRRGVFMVCAAVLLNFAMAFFLTGGYQLGVPDWLLIGPVVAWLLACGARQASRWLLDQTGWRSWIAVACEWLAPPVFLMAVWLGWWVYSVPLPDIPHAIRTLAVFRPPVTPSRIPVSTPVWQELSRAFRAMETAVPTPYVAPGSPADFLQGSVVKDWERLEQAVAKVRDSLLKLNGIPEEIAVQDVPDTMSFRLRVIHALMTLADQEFTARHAHDSARSVRAAIRITGLWSGNRDANDYLGPLAHAALHERLLQWAQRVAPDPDFVSVWDSDILRRREVLEKSEVPPFLLKETLETVEISDLGFWVSDGSFWIQEYHNDLKWYAAKAGWNRYLLLAETIRNQRLAACKLSNRLMYLGSYPPSQRGFGPILPVEDLRAHVPEWEYRERGISSNQPDRPLGLEPETIAAMWDAETRIRCTFACMAVTAYRHSYRRLPSSLAEAAHHAAPRSLLQDPWGPGLLQWEPSLGWKNAPFVWSVGPEHLSLIWNGDDLSFRQNAIETPNWTTVRQINTAAVRYAYAISPDP